MASGSSSNSTGKILKRANTSTIQDKFLVGYQGWFTCAGDGEPIGPGHHGWLHWFNHPIPDGGRPNTDFWPDVSAYSPSELFPAPGLKTKTGEQVFLFSSRNAKTVQRHFHWMAEHGVDGAFLQRFAGQCDLESGNEGVKRLRDEIGDRVREAAEKEGRVYAIMYDVSGVPADRIQRILEHDWMHLVRNKGVLDSPNYLKERGKPVIALWGLGFEGAGHTPALVRNIIQFFRHSTPGGVYIMGGAPSCWRTSEGDADRHPEFVDIWLNEFDGISPWTVGRYKTEQEADTFAETKMKGDTDLIKRRNEETGRKVDYVPVVLPGGSGYNLSDGKWGLNDIKRRGGRFLWKQISNAKRLGVRTMYGAMWDEYDEGTAFLPIVEHKRNLPQSDKFPFLALDEDGYDVPSDWYMRICGFAAEGLRSERRIHETFPVKELQDYWSSRPKYEEVSGKSADFVSGTGGGSGGGSGSGGDDGQTYADWLAAQKEQKDELPPPPYTLEADEALATTAAPVPTQQSTQASQPTVVSSVAPAAAAIPPITNQIPPLTTVVSQSSYGHSTGPIPDSSAYPPYGTPGGPGSGPGSGPSAQSNAPPVVNNSTYPPYSAPGGPVSGPEPSAHGYAPISSPTGPGSFQYQQQHPGQHDPVGALVNDFGRHNISGSPAVGSGATGLAALPHGASYGGPGGPPGVMASTSPSPIHPTHQTVVPAAGNIPTGYGSASTYPGPVPGRQSPPTSSSRPPNSTQSSRPASQSRPQSQQGYHPIPPHSMSAGSPPVASSGPVWPPPEWGASATVNATPAPVPPHSTYPTQGSVNTPTAVHSVAGPGPEVGSSGANLSRPQSYTAGTAGGANLTRPHTFTASSYGAGGGSGPHVRPSSSAGGSAHPHRPPSRPGTSGSNPATPGGYPPSTIAEHPPSGFPGPNSQNSHAGFGSASYSQPTASSYSPNATGPASYTPSNGPSSYTPTPTGGPPLHHSRPGFPARPNASTYTPPVSSYPGQTGPTYPGQPSGAYAHPVSNYGWSSGPPHGSPPQSPPGGGPSTFPNGPGQSYPNSSLPYNPSFPSNASSESTSPSYGAPQFPHGPGSGDGGGGYFGGGGPGSSGTGGMPSPDASSPYPSGPSSYYPGQHGPPTPSYPSHGHGHGSSVSYPQATPWGGAPSLPPRPPTQSAYGRPPSGPNFPMAPTAGSSALNYGLTAVEKVAGRKTKEQLESLAQSGSKLYSKFMK